VPKNTEFASSLGRKAPGAVAHAAARDDTAALSTM